MSKKYFIIKFIAVATSPTRHFISFHSHTNSNMKFETKTRESVYYISLIGTTLQFFTFALAKLTEKLLGDRPRHPLVRSVELVYLEYLEILQCQLDW